MWEVARRAGGASRSSTSPPHHVGRWPEGPVGAPRSSTSPPHHVGRWPEGPVGRFEHLIRLPTTWGGGPKGRWGVTVFNCVSRRWRRARLGSRAKTGRPDPCPYKP